MRHAQTWRQVQRRQQVLQDARDAAEVVLAGAVVIATPVLVWLALALALGRP